VWASGGLQSTAWPRRPSDRNAGGAGGRCLLREPSPVPLIVNVTKYRLFLSSLSVGKSMACAQGPLPSCSVIGLDGSTFRRHRVVVPPDMSWPVRMSGRKRWRRPSSAGGFGIWWWSNRNFGTEKYVNNGLLLSPYKYCVHNDTPSFIIIRTIIHWSSRRRGHNILPQLLKNNIFFTLLLIKHLQRWRKI